MRSMGVFKAGIVIAAILFCWLNSVQAGPNLWPSNKGEICLTNDSNGELVSLAVMRTVGKHYIVHGRSETTDGSITLINGNAEIIGGKILIHFSGSGYNTSQDEVHGGSGWVELDANTLMGWYRGIGSHCNPIECGLEYEGPQLIGPCH